MKALSTLLRREVEVVGAGRTDAGVHASLMVAHFDSDSPLDTVFMTDKLNRLLPPDISVYRLRAVKSDAHARFDATARMYLPPSLLSTANIAAVCSKRRTLSG